jgi:hypothetical protein
VAPAPKSELVVQAFSDGLAHVHAANPGVRLSVNRDPELGGAPLLLVSYPSPTDEPAGRDINCDAESQDWSSGSALTFRIKPAQALKLSVSFLDRNHVAYTTWIELGAAVWQRVRITFAEMQPNPYFQPPDAKKGAPIDVSEVKGIAFAPMTRRRGASWSASSSWSADPTLNTTRSLPSRDREAAVALNFGRAVIPAVPRHLRLSRQQAPGLAGSLVYSCPPAPIVTCCC